MPLQAVVCDVGDFVLDTRELMMQLAICPIDTMRYCLFDSFRGQSKLSRL